MAVLFNLGLNDRVTKTQLIETKDAIQMVANLVGDCTIMTGIGFYTHDDGERVVETTLEVKCYGMDMEQGMAVGKTLAREFNQECVCVSPLELQTEFVYQ